MLGDILDKNLRRGLVLSDGDLLPFFTRPISAVLAVLVLWTFITNVPIIHAAVLRWRDAVMARVLPRIPPLELTTCASRSATR